MNCSISGELPEEPVVSTKSGYLFEKRLIEQHISEHGKCPITGEVMTMEDIIPLKSAKVLNPTPISASIMPWMFQTEWDALMQSSMDLERQLRTARQELNRAVRLKESACGVISRLQKEKNEAKERKGSPARKRPRV